LLCQFYATEAGARGQRQQPTINGQDSPITVTAWKC